MNIIFFVLEIMILVIAVILVIYNRNERDKWIPYLTVCTFLAIFFLVLPTQWESDGAVWSPLLYKIISSMFYSFKTLGGGQSLEQFESIFLSGWARNIYMGLGYFISFMAPLLTSSLILSFVGDSIDRIRYFFIITPKCYVFSEINENTIAVAQNIKKLPERKKIVFCNCKDADKHLLHQAKLLHGILLYTSCKTLKIHSQWQVKEYEFNLLSCCEDHNIEASEILISKGEQLKKDHLIINAFVHNEVDINILESMMSQSESNGVIKLRFINEINLLCSNFLYQQPLYKTATANKEIIMLIIGCGVLGKEMLKTAIWNGQIEGYSLKIKVLDNHADQIEQEIMAYFPELNHYDIDFIKIDIKTPQFEETIKRFATATFICIATGSDDLNVHTAENVYQILRRLDLETTPPIYTRVRNSTKTNNMNQNIKYLSERNIHFFGTIESIYSECTLFNSELEKLAFAVHLCWDGQLNGDINSERYQLSCQQFYASSYNRLSSMACALHIPVKLHQCGIDISSIKDITDEQLQQIEEILSDETTIEKLARNEHERWNAFMRSEGWRKLNIETMRKNKLHQDKKAHTHSCIVSWDELNIVQDEYNKLGLTKKDFKEYDYLIISSIPEIIRKAKKL